MSPVPPPIASPHPDFDPGPETPSGVRKLTVAELRLIRAHDAAEAKAASKKLKNSSTLKAWAAFIGSVATATVMALGVVSQLDARAQARVDGGLAPVVERVGVVETDSKEVKARLSAVEHSATRTEAMVEMLVNNRGMRPPPKVRDGGEE